jgi:hypothetical protein
MDFDFPLVSVTVAVVFAFAGLLSIIWGFRALARRRPVRMVASVAFGLMLLAIGFLFGTLSVATRGYQALTKEEIVVVVTTEPVGEKRFKAHFRFPDGQEEEFDLAGDELYVDAHILKWKLVANCLGLHTAYEMDRVTGRYRKIDEEKSSPRTIYSLAESKPVDMFDLRQRYRFLSPLLDAEYGSATFITADRKEVFEVRVSTSGLLIRRRDAEAEPPPAAL